MSTNLNTIEAGITTLTIDGVTITKDIAKQLDQLRLRDWENFEPIGRVRTGIDHGDEKGVEILGRHKETGALVRMWAYHCYPLPRRLLDRPATERAARHAHP